MLFRSLKFYASVRMDVRRIETLKQSGEMVGNRTRIKIVKNKIAPPFKEAEFDIMFGKGISRSGDILDLAAGIDIIKKSGSWYAYEGEKIGQGRENAKAYLESNPQVMEAVEKKVREHYNLEGADKSEASDDLKLKPKEKASGKTSDKGSVKGAGKTSEKASDEEAGKTGAISEESVVKAGEVTEQAAAKAEEKKSRKSTVKAEL